MIEIWKPVPGLEEIYHISNYGRVKSLERTNTGKDGRIRTTKERILSSNKSGVTLYLNRKGRSFGVKKLVKSLFNEFNLDSVGRMFKYSYKPKGNNIKLKGMNEQDIRNYIKNLIEWVLTETITAKERIALGEEIKRWNYALALTTVDPENETLMQSEINHKQLDLKGLEVQRMKAKTNELKAAFRERDLKELREFSDKNKNERIN